MPRQLEARSEYLSVADVVRIYGYGRTLVYDHIKTGLLPALRLGRRIVLPRVELESVLRREAQKHAGAEAAS